MELTSLVLVAEGCELVEAALASGQDPNQVDSAGSTALHYAAILRRFDLAKVLITYGASIASQDRDGFTPLHSAASVQFEEGVRLFVECGARVDSPDFDGMTPLMVAASNGAVSICEYLIGRGVNVGATDAGGRTALHWAVLRNDSPQLVKLLQLNGADSLARDLQGMTVADVAQVVGHLKAFTVITNGPSAG